MNPRKIALLFSILLAGTGLAFAADLAGKWTSEFDSQIGKQKYTYEFKADGDHLSGKATYDHSMGKGEVALKDIKLSGNDVSFVEEVAFDGGPAITITYTGKVDGDEMKLVRQVGDFATENIVASRQKEPKSDKK